MKNVKKSIALVLALLMICGCAPADPGDTSDPTETVLNSGPTETTAPDPTETTEVTKPSADPTESTEATAATVPAATTPVQTTPAETQPTQTAPAVTYTEVNETVYVTAGTVNVRSGPGTEHAKLGSLSKGDSVKRIGIGDNGWSKVEYAGAPGYISTQYLSTTKPVDNSSVSYDGMEVVKEALKYLGLEYVYGGNSLTSGTDCSGFTKLIYTKFGIELPRTAAEQSKIGTKIDANEAKIGDLYVIEYESGAPYIGHAGIYIGGSQYISAMPGEGVVIRLDVYDELTVYRVGNNTYEGTWADTRFELMAYCIEELGMKYGISEVTYYPQENTCICRAYAGYVDWFSAEVDLINDAAEHPALVAKLKQKYLDDPNSCFRIDTTGDFDYAGFLNGKWYSSRELYDMEQNGTITVEERCDAQYFYGKPWDLTSTITTKAGETVDFSAFPG